MSLTAFFFCVRKYGMKNNTIYYRCKDCGRILNQKRIRKGECMGHYIIELSRGTFWEWVMVTWWRIKGER